MKRTLLPLAGALVLASCGREPPSPALVAREPVHVVVSGTDREMGLQHGLALAKEIREEVGVRLSARFRAAAKDDADARFLESACRAYTAKTKPLLPPEVAEELAGIAEGAGVSEEDVLLLEVMRDGLRFHLDAPPILEAAFSSPPQNKPLTADHSPGPLLVAAWDGPGAAQVALRSVFLARRPVQGSPSVVLTWPGGLGAFAGASPVGAFVQSEVPARRETLSLNGLPFGIALARTLWAQTPEDLEARVLGLSARNGNRVLLDVFEPRIRHVAVFAPATSPVRQRHEQEAWVLVPAGSTGDDPRGKAMDERLGAYETRPDRGHAVELAVSGRTSRELPVITIGRSAISWVRGVDAFGRRRPVSYRFPWP